MCKNAVHCCLTAAKALGGCICGGIGAGIGAVLVVLIAVAMVIMIAFVVKKCRRK